MDRSGDGGGGLTATGLFCDSCGAQSSPTAKFCGECGTRLTQATRSAEYKQVTVLRLAAVPTDPGFVLNDIWLLRLRALLAQAHEDDAAYCDYRDRYRTLATSLGFDGHMKWAEAMP